ncbi:MAG: cytochrome C oxidase subunit IV family protein [Leptospiraceae bacterium]|nr:cytochrome C oxidase subunit IV family protein [Leptospiraceae bacterium]
MQELKLENEFRTNLIVWLLAIALVFTGYALLESKTENLLSAILVISVVKFILIAFYFMEVRHAHIFWKALGLCFAVVFSSGFLIFT